MVRVIGDALAGRPVKLRVEMKGSTSGLVMEWDADGDNVYEARGFGTERTLPEAVQGLERLTRRRVLATKRRKGAW